MIYFVKHFVKSSDHIPLIRSLLVQSRRTLFGVHFPLNVKSSEQTGRHSSKLVIEPIFFFKLFVNLFDT